MTTVLNVFVENTKILPTPVNENFSGLQQDIADVNTTLSGSVSTLTTTVTSLSNTVTSQGSTITTQGTAISALESTVTNGYMKKDNSNADNTGKFNADKWAMPNYSGIYAIGTTGTASANGYILGIANDKTTSWSEFSVSINNILVHQTSYKSGDNGANEDGSLIPIAQGQTWSLTTSNVSTYFVPCIGG